jgi:hypothetical protein
MKFILIAVLTFPFLAYSSINQMKQDELTYEVVFIIEGLLGVKDIYKKCKEWKTKENDINRNELIKIIEETASNLIKTHGILTNSWSPTFLINLVESAICSHIKQELTTEDCLNINEFFIEWYSQIKSLIDCALKVKYTMGSDNLREKASMQAKSKPKVSVRNKPNNAAVLKLTEAEDAEDYIPKVIKNIEDIKDFFTTEQADQKLLNFISGKEVKLIQTKYKQGIYNSLKNFIINLVKDPSFISIIKAIQSGMKIYKTSVADVKNGNQEENEKKIFHNEAIRETLRDFGRLFRYALKQPLNLKLKKEIIDRRKNKLK